MKTIQKGLTCSSPTRRETGEDAQEGKDKHNQSDTHEKKVERKSSNGDLEVEEIENKRNEKKEGAERGKGRIYFSILHQKSISVRGRAELLGPRTREEKQDSGCPHRLPRNRKNMCQELGTSDPQNPTEKGIQSKSGIKKSYILIPS